MLTKNSKVASKIDSTNSAEFINGHVVTNYSVSNIAGIKIGSLVNIKSVYVSIKVGELNAGQVTVQSEGLKNIYFPKGTSDYIIIAALNDYNHPIFKNAKEGDMLRCKFKQTNGKTVVIKVPVYNNNQLGFYIIGKGGQLISIYKPPKGIENFFYNIPQVKADNLRLAYQQGKLDSSQLKLA